LVDFLIFGLMSQKEATARIKINDLLKEAGWILDPSDSRCNVQLDSNTSVLSISVDDFGDDFENVSKGFIDYLLLDEQGRPLVILETKSGDKGFNNAIKDKMNLIEKRIDKVWGEDE
jgi:type I restriction enzyme, R subunit